MESELRGVCRAKPHLLSWPSQCPHFQQTSFFTFYATLTLETSFNGESYVKVAHLVSLSVLTAKPRSQRSLTLSPTKRHFGKRCIKMLHSRVHLVHSLPSLSYPSSGHFSKLRSSQSRGRHGPCVHFLVLYSRLLTTHLNSYLDGGSSCLNRADDSCCMMPIL